MTAELCQQQQPAPRRARARAAAAAAAFDTHSPLHDANTPWNTNVGRVTSGHLPPPDTCS